MKDEAVKNNDFARAAQLRDALLQLDNRSPPSGVISDELDAAETCVESADAGEDIASAEMEAAVMQEAWALRCEAEPKQTSIHL